MSVLGSQLEIDIDPEGEATIMPRHLGNTGTGCFKLHDHRFVETKHRTEGPVPPPGPGLIINKDDEPKGLNPNLKLLKDKNDDMGKFFLSEKYFQVQSIMNTFETIQAIIYNSFL